MNGENKDIILPATQRNAVLSVKDRLGYTQTANIRFPS